MSKNSVHDVADLGEKRSGTCLKSHRHQWQHGSVSGQTSLPTVPTIGIARLLGDVVDRPCLA